MFLGTWFAPRRPNVWFAKAIVVILLAAAAWFHLTRAAVVSSMPQPLAEPVSTQLTPGTRPALAHEIESALSKLEIKTTELKNRISVAEKALTAVSGQPEVIIVQYGHRWDGLELGYTVLLLRGMPAVEGSSGPYHKFMDMRLIYDWRCFGELIGVVAKGVCKNPVVPLGSAANPPTQELPMATQDDIDRWFGKRAEGHNGIATLKGEPVLAPRYKDWAYVVLEPGARLRGGSLGLNQVTTAERYRNGELRWTMLYDPFCEEVSREIRGMSSQPPLREYLPEALLERYAPCTMAPLNKLDATVPPEPTRPPLG